MIDCVRVRGDTPHEGKYLDLIETIEIAAVTFPPNTARSYLKRTTYFFFQVEWSA